MSYHFSMGAINTNHYEYPRIANKKNKYKCPGCEKDVIFKKGTILHLWTIKTPASRRFIIHKGNGS